MRFVRILWTISLFAVLISCGKGGDSPTNPSTPTPPPILEPTISFEGATFGQFTVIRNGDLIPIRVKCEIPESLKDFSILCVAMLSQDGIVRISGMHYPDQARPGTNYATSKNFVSSNKVTRTDFILMEIWKFTDLDVGNHQVVARDSVRWTYCHGDPATVKCLP